ncbi:MAG: glycolate oxidase subunit GlcE [Betaproteobacteria bacterium]
MRDEVLAGWQARIRAAHASRTPLRIRGGGTKDFYGHAPTGETLDTTDCEGIVDYDPTELVITARAGTRLTEIEEAMRGAGQMLAFEPPHFGAAATLGGAIATGLSGPRRPYAGAVRDLMLGVRVIDGTGEDLTFGGRVMKNVAGFDVARLMTGALGTLGVIAEASLKCLPLPKAEATRVLECSADEAIRTGNEWGGKPLPLSATCYRAGRLAVRLSGAAPAVDAAIAKIGGEALADDATFWTGVREHTDPFFAAAPAGAPLWRLAVKSTAPYTDLSGEQLIEWGGGLRWLAAGEQTDPARVRAWAKVHGGHATLFRAADKSAGVFQPLPPPLMEIHRRLKAEFDPAGILNPGRLYPGL